MFSDLMESRKIAVSKVLEKYISVTMEVKVRFFM